MSLPTWLYEALPQLYVGVGVVALGALDHPVGRFAGVTLVAAGVIVWLARRRYRRAKKKGASSSSPGGTTGPTSITDQPVPSYYNNYD